MKGLLGEDLGPLRGRGDGAPSTLSTAALRPSPWQPRRAFDSTALTELAASIRSQGVLQPLLVRPAGEGYEIVAGERRWRAAQQAGLTEVPVLIRALDDQQARVAALIENLQRENLNVIEEIDGKLALVALALNTDLEGARARLVQLLREAPGADHAALNDVFAPLGESWLSFAKNKLRVLRWPTELVDALRAGLPLTLGALIAGAPPEHHGALIALALGGASRTQLRAEAQRLGKVQKTIPSRAAHAARQLGSRRFMAGLSADDQQAVEKWLARMPAALLRESD
nr:ParB/RepB/Spo0J family partition protein [Deinococcus betulae]